MNHKYYFIFVPLILIFLIIIIHLIRRKIIIKKIDSLSTEEKCRRLNSLIYPFGYYYDHYKNTFHSTLNAWQRNFGYGQIYDRMAPHFNMIFDCLPVYFDYDGRTWLIEFWKGQYGINIGAEIGIYKSDRLLNKDEYDTEIFQSITNDELFPLCMNISCQDEELVCICEHHWWLTAFKMGRFANPKNLSLDVCLTFPNFTMLNNFVDALSQHPLAPEAICGSGLNVSFLFDTCSTCDYCFFKRMYTSFVQWKNRCLCGLFAWITSPFTVSMDQILYLYEYAPFAFRKLFTIHSQKLYKKGCRKNRRK